MINKIIDDTIRRAIKILQSTINDASTDFGLAVDGIIGKKREDFYLKIVENDESQLEFLPGWLNRLNEFMV